MCNRPLKHVARLASISPASEFAQQQVNETSALSIMANLDRESTGNCETIKVRAICRNFQDIWVCSKAWDELFFVPFGTMSELKCEMFSQRFQGNRNRRDSFDTWPFSDVINSGRFIFGTLPTPLGYFRLSYRWVETEWTIHIMLPIAGSSRFSCL